MPDSADHLGLRSENLCLRNIQVADKNLLAELDRSTVNFYKIRQVVYKTEAFEFADADNQATAILYAFGASLDLNRNVDGYRLVFTYREEIHMAGCICNCMPLYLLKNGQIVLSVDFKIDDVVIRSVGDLPQILCVYGERYVLHSVSVQIARNPPCVADSIDIGFLAVLPELSFQKNLFHKELIKCVTQFGFSKPHCTKKPGFLSGLQK